MTGLLLIAATVILLSAGCAGNPPVSGIEQAPTLPGISPESTSSRSIWVPDFTILQVAGFAGVIAGGLGYDPGKNHSIALLLGYVPPEIAGVELWQLVFKYEWRSWDPVVLSSSEAGATTLNPLHFGFGLIYVNNSRLFVQLPEQYPRGYYNPTALRWTVTIGSSLRNGPSVYFLEFTALDIGFLTYIENQGAFAEQYDYYGLEGIGSLAAGVRIDIL